MKLPIINHKDYFAKIGDDHRFPINKFGDLADYLLKKKLVKSFYTPYPCSDETLKRVHCEKYIKHVKNKTLDEKSVKKILSPTRIKVNYSTNSSKPNAGSQLANTLTRGTYRMDVNQKATNLKVRIDANSAGDECGAVGVLFRTKRSPR